MSISSKSLLKLRQPCVYVRVTLDHSTRRAYLQLAPCCETRPDYFFRPADCRQTAAEFLVFSLVCLVMTFWWGYRHLVSFLFDRLEFVERSLHFCDVNFVQIHIWFMFDCYGSLMGERVLLNCEVILHIHHGWSYNASRERRKKTCTSMVILNPWKGVKFPH